MKGKTHFLFVDPFSFVAPYNEQVMGGQGRTGRIVRGPSILVLLLSAVVPSTQVTAVFLYLLPTVKEGSRDRQGTICNTINTTVVDSRNSSPICAPPIVGLITRRRFFHLPSTGFQSPGQPAMKRVSPRSLTHIFRQLSTRVLSNITVFCSRNLGAVGRYQALEIR